MPLQLGKSIDGGNGYTICELLEQDVNGEYIFIAYVVFSPDGTPVDELFKTPEAAQSCIDKRIAKLKPTIAP